MPRDAEAPDAAAAPREAPAVEAAGLELARVEAAGLIDVLLERAAAGFGMLVDLFGVDTGEGIEITYHLRSLGAFEDARIRVRIDYDGELPSAWEAYPAALYPERELAEMFGVTFSGHPNPKRLLTTDEIGCFPLRRSVPVRTHEQTARPGMVRRAVEDAGEEGGGDD